MKIPGYGPGVMGYRDKFPFNIISEVRARSEKSFRSSILCTRINAKYGAIDRAVEMI
jgi:hypothetical protein